MTSSQVLNALKRRTCWGELKSPNYGRDRNRCKAGPDIRCIVLRFVGDAIKECFFYRKVFET
jgi:hypothetical protein